MRSLSRGASGLVAGFRAIREGRVALMFALAFPNVTAFQQLAAQSLRLTQ